MNWYTIVNEAGKPVTISIYGTIGRNYDGTGVDAKEFVNALDQIPKGTDITLRVHSPGGYVFDGLMIHNRLKERRENLVGIVDGLAASSASWVLNACKEIRIPKSARLMIHDAEGGFRGNAAAMADASALLNQESANIAEMYAERPGMKLPVTQIREMMRNTTWMNGAQAVRQGFADTLLDVNPIKNEFDLSCFRPDPGAGENQNKTAANASGEIPKQMDRLKVIALLAAQGLTLSNEATDEQLLEALGTLVKKPDQTKVPDPLKVENTVTIEMITALRNQVEDERRKRVEAIITPLCTQRGVEVKNWLPRALADESIIDELRKMPTSTASPLLTRSIANLGNSVREQYTKLEPGLARIAYRVANQAGLLQPELWGLPFNPHNANTIAAGLTTDALADGVHTIANNKLALLKAFTRDFGMDSYKPRATVQIRKATTGSAAVANATDFEVGDSTLVAVPVAVNQITKGFQVTNDELHKGTRLEHLASINADLFCNAISDVVTGAMSVAVFGTPYTIGTAVSMATTKLPPIMAAAKNFVVKHLLLDGSYLAYLLPTDRTKFVDGEAGAYGFDMLLAHNRWTGATSNTVGLICSPDCIAVVAGLPFEAPGGQMLSTKTYTLPGLGLSIQLNSWYSLKTRTLWSSYDVMFGAGVLDITAAQIIVSS